MTTTTWDVVVRAGVVEDDRASETVRDRVTHVVGGGGFERARARTFERRVVFVDAKSEKRAKSNSKRRDAVERDSDHESARAAHAAVKVRDAALMRMDLVSRGGADDVSRVDLANRREWLRASKTCAPAIASRSFENVRVKDAMQKIDEAHGDGIRAMRALCFKSNARARSIASDASSATHVLIETRDDTDDETNDDDEGFGIAVTTRHVVRTVREYRPRWRSWLPERVPGQKPLPPPRRACTASAKKLISIDTVTVAEPVVKTTSVRVDDESSSEDWAWPFLDTGSVADGLIRVACARSDERARAPAAAVEITDYNNLTNSATFTYEDLFDRSVKAAAFMRHVLGVRPGDVVGVLSSNSHQVYLLHHACSLVRCTLLNLNTHLVARELSYIVRDSHCKFIFARASHADVLHEVIDASKVSAIDAVVWIGDSPRFPRSVKNFDWTLDVMAYEVLSRAFVVNNAELASKRNAHLYYTSGTTGNPKGVTLTHDIVRAHAHATGEEMRLQESDVWLHAAPMFHLVDAFAIYSITNVGGRHVFLPAFEASRLLRVVAFERVTVSNLASSMVSILAHNPFCDVCDLSSLRVVSCGGSPLPPTVVKRAIALFGCEFFVSYGMTECCGKISMSILSDDFREARSLEEQLDAICTSGRPFSLMSVRVTRSDDPDEDVPSDGETVGDVRVRGPTVFAEYLNDADATHRAFDEDGWFATGDLGVMRPDGYLVVVDRKKDMILSGGENVYCVEVERVLHSHDSVQQAAAFGVPHAIMGESVHAAVTLWGESASADKDAIARALSKHCRERLSEFKCPTEIHIVDVLPMNASGKILKRNLRELVTDEAHHRRSQNETRYLQRQFSRAVITTEPSKPKSITSKEDVDADDDIPGAEMYVSALVPLAAGDIECRLSLHGERWIVFGSHARLQDLIKSLGADVEATNHVVDAREDWFAHASRYRKYLVDVKSGDTIVLAECLQCFESKTDGEAKAVAAATYLAAGLVLSLIRAIEAANVKNVRVVVLTSNAFVASDEAELDGIRDGRISHAPLIAMMRVLRREHTGIDFATLDVSQDGERLAGLDALKLAIQRITDDESVFAERELIVRDASVSTPRLRRAYLRGESRLVHMFASGASCVIIGGLGALGAMHLNFVAKQFNIRRFVLVGRSIRENAIASVSDAVTNSNATSIDIVAADCCDEDQARAVFLLSEPVALTLHLAGVLNEHAAVDVTRASFVAGAEAKIDGSLNIFAALSERSSQLAIASTSIFGHIGQLRLTSYAAANAFQDALCAVKDRSTGGGPDRVVAVQWGTWDEAGMAARSGAAFRAYWTNLGMGFITPAAALEFVRRIVEARAITPPSMACFPPTDWFKFFNATRSAGAPPAFIEECLPPPDDSSSSSSVSSEPLTTKAMDPCFISTVRGVVLEVLDAKTIDDDAPLMSVGLTSTRAIQLTDRLSKATGRAVPSTLAFDYPTLRDILAHFVSDNDLHLRSMSPSVVETGRDEITKVYFIASASIAPSAIGRGKFMDGGDSVDVVPLTRWDTAVAESLCVFGVFVEECFMFDARVFGVSHAEACVIDPQQRLVLRVVASLPKPTAAASVHVGVSQVEHPRMHLNARIETLSPYYATSAHLSVAAGRVSYVFALTGCAESIDTACSSSLVAIHRGFVSHHRRDDALAGGVNLTLDVTWSLACAAANMLATDGRCKTLDSSADGYVRAEQCSMTLVGSDLERSFVELAGAAVNQDGRSSTLTAPNGPAQTRVIRATYNASKHSEDEVPIFVAMHGTGTALGDPIEVGALRAAARDGVIIRVCAVKSIVGHSEPASGVAGLLLAADGVQTFKSTAMTHVRAVNPHLTSGDNALDLAIPRARVAMTDAESASASAFAFQGTNAHALVRRIVFRGGESTAASPMTAKLERSFACCQARFGHGWIKHGEILYGRIVYVAKLVADSRASAALFDHAVHGERIAPGTSLLELFLESFTQSVSSGANHGCDIVIPHAMRLVSDKKNDGLVVNVIARRHDGRASVTTGPLCRPRTHLYGRVSQITAVGKPMHGHRQLFANKSAIVAKITREHASATRQSQNTTVNVYALDAAIHLAEGVLQWDGKFAARVPAALESIFCAFRHRGDGWREPRTMYTECATAKDGGDRSRRAYHNHTIPGTVLKQLDIRPPFRFVRADKDSPIVDDAKKIASNPKSYSMYVAIALVTASTRTRKPAKREHLSPSARAQSNSGTRSVTAYVHHLSLRFKVLYTITLHTFGASSSTFDAPSALVGATRSAAHELASEYEFKCVDQHVNAVETDEDGAYDPWQTATFQHDSLVIHTLALMPSSALTEPVRRRELLERAANPAPPLLVFGGFGALGARAAQGYTHGGDNRRVIVVGRSGRARNVARRTSHSAIIRARRLDTAVIEDARDNNLDPMTHRSRMVYASGVLADAYARNVTARSVFATFGPKMVRDDFMDVSLRASECTAVFSSATACVGNAGQISYGAANATLDRRVSAASRAGLKTISLQWGAFAGGGMAAGVETRMTRIGIGLLPPSVGVGILRAFMVKCFSTSRCCVGAFDWATYTEHHARANVSPFFANVVGVASSSGGEKHVTQLQPKQSRGSAVALDAKQIVYDAMKAILGSDASVSDANAPFFSLGLDSLSSVEFTTAVESKLDHRLPATLVFDYPSPLALVRYIQSLQESATTMAAKGEFDDRLLPERDEAQNERDVVSAAGADAPGAYNHRGFDIGHQPWRGDDRVSRVMFDRWDCERTEYATIPRFAGFYACDSFWRNFDSQTFGLQTNELVVMDPQQRSILHRTAVSLRRMCVDDGRASVYIGAATSDYKSIVYEARFEANPFFSTGSAFISVIAGRVSFVFNLSGGSLAIDTACSSAMCAIHVARGDVDVPLRITGGVNALLDARSSAMFAGAGMLANDGRCKTFDVAADGYSRAEACAIVVIHRYCVKPTASIVLLAGTSVNQDGRSSALTAPNGPSQTRVIRDATCVIDRTDLRLLSLHGTGTPLGDPIEIGAASAVIPTNAVLMATKTSCAHSESPSGLMGALAALTTLTHAATLAIAHLRILNAYVEQVLKTTDFATPRTKFAVTRAGTSSAAGASAFAFQGTNAHGVFTRSHVSSCGTGARTRLFWHQIRSWPAPLASPLIQRRYDDIFSIRPNIGTYDHRVRDRAILPGAAYLECIHAYSKLMNATLTIAQSACFNAPCLLTTPEAHVYLRVSPRFGRSTFESYSDRTLFALVNVATASIYQVAHRFDVPTRQRRIFEVAGIVSRSSSRAVEIDASFHFISATWRNDDGLRIPRTVDFSCLTEKLLGRSMGIAYVSPHMHVSKHASVDARVVGLRMAPLSSSRVTFKSPTPRAYVVARRRVVSRRPSQSITLSWNVSNHTRSALVALTVPWASASLAILSESCAFFGAVALARSVAMESSRVRFIQVNDAHKHMLDRHRVVSEKCLNTRAPLAHFERVCRTMDEMLIIGGAGALGRHFTRYFGAFTHVRWTSTSGRARILAYSAVDTMLQVDVQSSDAPPPSLVVRASGVLADASWRNVAARSARLVFASKFVGMDDYSAHVPVVRAVALSSIAGLLGSLGQAVYAGANQMLDERCKTFAARGLDAKALQYGPWLGEGMGNDDAVRTRLKMIGMGYLDPQIAVAATRAIAMNMCSPTVTCVATVDWTTHAKATHRGSDAMLENLTVDMTDNGIPNSNVVTSNVAESHLTAATTKSWSHAAALKVICACVERAIGSSTDASVPFMDAGVDSVTSTDISGELSRAFAMTLPATFLFDYPTPISAATFISRELKSITTPLSDVVASSSVEDAKRSVFLDGICAFDASPNAVDDINPIHSDKWDINAARCADNLRLPAAFMRSMSRLDAFDPDVFGMHVDESRRCDCQQRLALRAASAFRDARDTKFAVYVGVASRDYGDAVSATFSSRTSYDAVGSFGSVVSGRISYVFNFTGPACSIDTACSSALVAAHMARAEMALRLFEDACTGGVNVILRPTVTEQFNRAGMLSLSGRCQTLDAAADGYVRAESCGLLRLVVSEESFKRVANFRASRVNQDGRSSSLTAPNGPSQMEVVVACQHDDAFVAHLHGTGTPLGDPIEVNALLECRSMVRLEASKSWIGHAEPASGIISVVYLMDQFSARRSSGIARLTRVNSYIATANDVRICVHRIRAPTTNLLSAGASAFAFQGTNAHVALRFNQCNNRSYITQRLGVENARRVWFEPFAFVTLTRVNVTHVDVILWMGSVAAIVGVEDHRVRARGLFPGAGMMRLVASAGVTCLDTHDARSSLACVGAVIPSSWLMSEGGGRYELRLRQDTGVFDIATQHCVRFKATSSSCSKSGTLYKSNAGSHQSQLGREGSRARHSLPLDAEFIYEALAKRGLEYGRRFRVLRTVRTQNAHVMSRIAVIAGVSDELDRIAALDGAMQLAAPTALNVKLAVPVGCDAYLACATDDVTRNGFVAANVHSSSTSEHTMVSDVDEQDAFRLLRLCAKTIGKIGQVRRASAAASYYVERHALVFLANKTFGDLVRDHARCATSVLESLTCVREDIGADVRGVETEHALGLVKSVASETFLHDIRSNGSRASESHECVDRLASSSAHRSITPRRIGFGAAIESPQSIEGVRVIGAFGALGAVAVRSAIESSNPSHMSLTGRTGRGQYDFQTSSTFALLCVLDGSARDAASRNLPKSKSIHRDYFVSGAIIDALLRNQSVAVMRYVFAPKTHAIKLETQDDHRSRCSVSVYFSSIAALLGSSGQANYAAANGTVDNMARCRRHTGMSAVSVQFGPWASRGMATRNAATMRRLESMGIGALSADEGVMALLSASDYTSTVRAVICFASFNVPVLAQAFEHLPELLLDLSPPTVASKGLSVSSPTAPPAISLDAERVERDIAGIIERALGCKIARDAPLMQSGLDSLSAVDVASAASERFKVNLPSTTFFDHPTIVAAAREIVRLRLGRDALAMHHRATERTVMRSETEASSLPRVVARAGELAFGAMDRDSVRFIPVERESSSYIDAPNAFNGFATTFLRVSEFDSYAFGPATASELIRLDPRQRLLIDAAAKCLFDLKSEPTVGTGTYVGCAGKDYVNLLRLHGMEYGAFAAVGNETSVVAGRLAYVFGLQGPALSVDTACSSSLCAASLALMGCSSTPRALIAGASLVFTDDMHRALGGAGMLSATGRCRAFDAEADGYGRAEAIEVLVSDVNGSIGAVFAGGAMNQDGRSSSLTAPSGQAQRDVIERASDAGERCARVLHAHGTGTALGDPIEVNAAVCALERATETLQFQALKSWIGHSEPAAGIVSLAVALAMALGARRSSGICHLRRVNDHVRFMSGNSDFIAVAPRTRVANECASADGRLLAHASAFAFQGTNAHVVLSASSSELCTNVIRHAKRVITHSHRYWPAKAHLVRSVTCSRHLAMRLELISEDTSVILLMSAAASCALNGDACVFVDFVTTHECRAVRRLEVKGGSIRSPSLSAYVRRRTTRIGQVRDLVVSAFTSATVRCVRLMRSSTVTGVLNGTPATCDAFVVSQNSLEFGRLIAAETYSGGLSVCASRGILLHAAGLSRHHRRLKSPRRQVVCYEIVDNDEVVVPRGARETSMVIVLVQTVLPFSQSATDPLGGAFRVVLRCADESRPRQRLRPVASDYCTDHRGSLRKETLSGALVLGGTGALGRAIVTSILVDSTSYSRTGRTQYTVSDHEIVRIDCAVRADLAAVPSRRHRKLALHAGGVLLDGALINQTHDAARRVFAPKLPAAKNVVDINSKCSRHILFSSVAALVAPEVQVNYASANASLDEYALYSRMRGSCVTSIRWGAFEGVGMASARTLAMGLARLGLEPLPMHRGLEILRSVALGATTPATFVASPFMQSYFRRETEETTTASEASSLQKRSNAAHFDANTITSGIAKIVHGFFGMRDIPLDAPMMANGLDSISSVELRDELSREFDVELPTTVAFDYPSINALAAFVVTELGTREGSVKVQNIDVDVREANPTIARTLYAIARSARLFTGDDANDNLLNETKGAIAVPAMRWRVDADGVRFAAFIMNVDAFDYELFVSSAPEARAMDPQHRGVLERVYACVMGLNTHINDAVGVFIGIQHFEYGTIQDPPGPFSATGVALSACSGRASYVFGFNGPSLSVDTACSASLTSVHLAMYDHSASRAYMCGGVNYMLGRTNCDAVHIAGMLAQDGRCKTLDSRADGYGRGEAVACLLLSPDETASFFVVCASACGQDGRSTSLTAPNGPAQRRVVAQAWFAVEDFVADISMHGTGTPLGDPIECGSLREFVERDRRGRSLSPITLLASKSSVGHAEAASGSASLLHLAARFDLSVTPSVVGLSRLNQHVVVSSLFHMPRQRTVLTMRDGDVASGCSAFAFVGTNVHVVVRKISPSIVTSNRVIFDRESLWPRMLLPDVIAQSDGAFVRLGRGNVADFVVARLHEGATCWAVARLMLACACACDGNRRRQRALATDVVVQAIAVAVDTAVEVSVHCDLGSVSVPALGAKSRCLCSRSLSRSSQVVQKFKPARMLCVVRHEGVIDAVSVIKGVAMTTIEAYHSAHCESLVTCSKITALTSNSTARYATREIMIGYGTSSEKLTPLLLARPRSTAIRQPYAERAKIQRADVTTVVFKVLRELFGEEMGPNDDLSSKGLDSIGAIELATTIKRELHIDEDVDMAILATLPTASKIVAFLQDLSSSTVNALEVSTPSSKTEKSQMVKSLRASDRTPSLYLGAPAFGDGPLAYMKLVRALELGAHPARTLERDVTQQPWPQVAVDHADLIMQQQGEGSIAIGGHSLGGVLAVETALAIERAGRELSTIFLFDAPHPAQFKPDWNDLPESISDDESTGLKYMEVALQSFHFDTVAAGWSKLSREEKYTMFESVAFQAVGREFDAKKLDEDISRGPYAAQWNSGMPLMEDGSIDSGAWWMLCGVEAAERTDTRSPRTGTAFARVNAKVIHYKAGIESAALFETDLLLEDNGAVLQSVGGYVWPLACDHVEIVKCRGTHMNLMTDEIDGGDLIETIAPHMRQTLALQWRDLHCIEGVSKRQRSSSWTSRVWHSDLGLWMFASPALDEVEELPSNQTSKTNESILNAVNSVEKFDCAVMGLNHQAWDPSPLTPQVWMVGSLLTDVESWSHVCVASTLSCRAVHIPRDALAVGMCERLAARFVSAMRNASGFHECADKFEAPIIIVTYGDDIAYEQLSHEIARQLKRRGENTITLIIAAKNAPPKSKDAFDSPAIQALSLKLAETSVENAPATLITHLKRIKAVKHAKILKHAKRFLCASRPQSVRSEAWRAEIDAEIRRAETLLEYARAAFHPRLRTRGSSLAHARL